MLKGVFLCGYLDILEMPDIPDIPDTLEILDILDFSRSMFWGMFWGCCLFDPFRVVVKGDVFVRRWLVDNETTQRLLLRETSSRSIKKG